MINRIRELRQARGWSLQRLAEASGTSKSQIDKLEKGSRRLTVDWMVRLAKPLACDPRDLMAASVNIKNPAFEPVRFGGKDVNARLIPVYRDGKKGSLLTEPPIDYVPRPYFLAHVKDAYAIYVPDPAMTPMYRPRQLLFIHPYKPPSPGGGVAIIDKKGAVLIREFVSRKPKGIVVREYWPRRRDLTIPQSDVAGLHAVAGAAEPQ